MGNDYKNEFMRTFHILSYSYNKWEVWKDFIFMAAAAISNRFDKNNYDKRENQYLKLIRKYKPKEQALFPKLLAKVTVALEENPDQDFLGSIFMELNLNNNDRGQFFTPYDVCKMMSSISIGNIEELIKNRKPISISDCACGSGSTLIAAINKSKEEFEKIGKNYQKYLLVTGQDIDQTVALMCYIQISLLGVAGYIKVGDSLSNPMSENDTYEDYWYTPMYYINRPFSSK